MQKSRWTVSYCGNFVFRGISSECMYCDAKRDMYRMIRKSEDFILASEGNYSGAVEQLTLELAEYKDQDTILQQLRVEALAKI